MGMIPKYSGESWQISNVILAATLASKPPTKTCSGCINTGARAVGRVHQSNSAAFVLKKEGDNFAANKYADISTFDVVMMWEEVIQMWKAEESRRAAVELELCLPQTQVDDGCPMNFDSFEASQRCQTANGAKRTRRSYEGRAQGVDMGKPARINKHEIDTRLKSCETTVIRACVLEVDEVGLLMDAMRGQRPGQVGPPGARAYSEWN
ncbi:hypothetical protein B0H19DRAFT_1073799 [Mycena capillaripes]|nr:hypothetical protein B0H19DRAFT_1073799 [Mycena capillaripes]